jgi:hypothetical protein
MIVTLIIGLNTSKSNCPSSNCQVEWPAKAVKKLQPGIGFSPILFIPFFSKKITPPKNAGLDKKLDFCKEVAKNTTLLSGAIIL